jgi:MFS family permease
MMRPIGSIIFGHIGDRHGRKRALMISVTAMALSTFAIGLLPTYAQIGSLAPLLLILLRMIQGTSVGGEYTTSIIFLVEQSAPHQRGFIGSWASFSATAGILLGSLVGALVTRLFDPADVLAWGWRLPFLPGILLGAVAYIMRRQLLEEDHSRVHFDRLPCVEAFQTSGREVVRGFVIIFVMAVSFYLIFVYLATYLQQVDSISATRALTINTISMIFLLIITPFAGMLADRFGRKTMLAAGAAGFTALSWPLFLLLDHPTTIMILLFRRASRCRGGDVSASHPLLRLVRHLQCVNGTGRRHRANDRGLSHGYDAQSDLAGDLSDGRRRGLARRRSIDDRPDWETPALNVRLWFVLGLFHHGNAAHQPPKQVGAGDDALLILRPH